MSIGNVNNNSAAQLQFYAQEKNALSTKAEQQEKTSIAQVASGSDSVQISDRARLLFEQNAAQTTLGNGGGIEPPKTTPGDVSTTLGNGGGIEPPKTTPGGVSTTLGNGGGIEPPKTTPGDVNTILGNGGGIEPPKTTPGSATITLGNGAGIEPPSS